MKAERKFDTKKDRLRNQITDENRGRGALIRNSEMGDRSQRRHSLLVELLSFEKNDRARLQGLVDEGLLSQIKNDLPELAELIRAIDDGETIRDGELVLQIERLRHDNLSFLPEYILDPRHTYSRFYQEQGGKYHQYEEIITLVKRILGWRLDQGIVANMDLRHVNLWDKFVRERAEFKERVRALLKEVGDLYELSEKNHPLYLLVQAVTAGIPFLESNTDLLSSQILSANEELVDDEKYHTYYRVFGKALVMFKDRENLLETIKIMKGEHAE